MAAVETNENDVPVHGRVTPADVEANTPGLQHDADLPRASERTSPIIRSILSTLGIGLGFAALCWGLSGLFFTTAVDDGNDKVAAAWMAGGGACFVVAGIAIWRDSLLWTALAAIGGAICGIVSAGWA